MAEKEKPESLPKVKIVISGLSRSGKSTALNNIFDVSFKAEPSATSVTQDVECKEVTKHGTTMKIVDTPGLKALDLDEQKVLQKMALYGTKNEFILVMIMSAGLGAIIGNDYSNMVKNLTSILGKGIWERCVLLLTFSDNARADAFSNDNEGYLKYLQEHCKSFEQELRKNKVTRKVTLFSEYASKEKFQRETLDGVVAIPVGKRPHPETTSTVLPWLTWAHDTNWTDLVTAEILKLLKRAQPTGWLVAALIRFKYGWYVVKNKPKEAAVAVAAGAADAAIRVVPGVMERKRRGVDIKTAVVGGAVLGTLGGLAALRDFTAIEHELTTEELKDAET